VDQHRKKKNSGFLNHTTLEEKKIPQANSPTKGRLSLTTTAGKGGGAYNARLSRNQKTSDLFKKAGGEPRKELDGPKVPGGGKGNVSLDPERHLLPRTHAVNVNPFTSWDTYITPPEQPYKTECLKWLLLEN